MIALLIALGASVWIAYHAAHGAGYRGLYFGLCLVALAGGAGCVALIPSGRQYAAALSGDDAGQAEGTRILFEYGYYTAIVWFSAAFGALVGGVIYRKPASASPAGVVSVNAMC